MEMILGLMGMIQACFLPGFLFILSRGIDLRLSTWLFYVFGTSLTINYIIVMLLVSAGLYTQESMLVIFFCEITAALLFIKSGKFKNSILRNLPQTQTHLLHSRTALLAAIVAFFAITSLFTSEQVFSGWDAVVSWNRWAGDLASNTLPHGTYYYPQLLPAMMSIPYIFMNDSTFFLFSHRICCFFFPLTLIAAYSIANKKGITISAVTILFCIFWFYYTSSIVGLADFPVLMMALFTICALDNWVNAKNAHERTLHTSCIVLFAAGAAVTKQAGLTLLIALPFIMSEFYLLAGRKHFPKTANIWKPILAIWACILLISLPWYVYTHMMVLLGKNSSEISWVMGGIHEGRGAVARILLALKAFPAVFLFLLLALPGLFIKGFKSIAIFGITFIVLWAILLSYDARNASFAIPFVAIACGAWLSSPLNITRNHLRILKNIVTIGAILCVFTLYAFNTNILNTLQQRQHRHHLKRYPGPEVNSLIFNILKNDKSSYVLYNSKQLGLPPHLTAGRLIPWEDDFYKKIRTLLISTPEVYVLVEGHEQLDSIKNAVPGELKFITGGSCGAELYKVVNSEPLPPGQLAP